MQSFSRSIQLARRHALSSSKNVDFSMMKHAGGVKFIGNSIDYDLFSQSFRKFTSQSSFALTRSCTQVNLLATPNNGGMNSVAILYENMGFFHLSIGETFPSRCFSTTADSSGAPRMEHTSASSSNVAPRIKFKRLDKTAKHIMQILDKEAVEEVKKQREIPDIRPGHIIQLKVEVPENKRRVSIVKGIVIARRNAGLNTTFRVRRLVAGVGVESLFPLYSPNIKEIKILDKKKVRRAKLYYLREKMNALKKN